MAFMSYAAKASLGFDFDTHGHNGYSKAGAGQLIDKITQLGGDERNLNQGLDMTSYVLSVRAGAREGARKVCVMCTFLTCSSPYYSYQLPHCRFHPIIIGLICL